MAVKMELPFAMFIVVEVRSTIRVLTAHGKMRKEILQEVNALYGGGCMSKTRVYECQNMFLCGRTNLADEERSGRPSDSTSAFENIEFLVSRYNKCLDLNVYIISEYGALKGLYAIILRFSSTCVYW